MGCLWGDELPVTGRAQPRGHGAYILARKQATKQAAALECKKGKYSKPRIGSRI